METRANNEATTRLVQRATRTGSVRERTIIRLGIAIRVRAQELFEFEYVLEMYKPQAQRRWGYFALPILHEDRLVGKLDAKADRKGGILQIHTIHEDVPFDRPTRSSVHSEVEALAAWLGLEIAGL